MNNDHELVPHELIPERNQEAEALRQRLVQLGATMDRQWGGAPVFVVHLPTKPASMRGVRYEDYPDRASARLDCMRDAMFELACDSVFGGCNSSHFRRIV